MDLDRLGPDAPRSAQEILGYLNFSSGAPSAPFLRELNRLYGRYEAGRSASSPPPWEALPALLLDALSALREKEPAFRRSAQAEAALVLAFGHLLPAYQEHHRDLLFHQPPEALFRPFFLGRCCEAVLAQGPPWDQTERIVTAALARLNDYVGYRPLAVLRTAQRMQPYAHERVAVIPLYLHGAGVAAGRYHDIIQRAWEILQATDADLLQQSWFTPGLLEELALDPRAYDFDHPAHRRPNHHFGGWDPDRIDNRGSYRRYVLQQVTLDALVARAEQHGDLPYEEILFESAAVLAGTILMGSGITGSGPECHDSETSLTTLLPHIAAYRDAFYGRLLSRLSGRHARRLHEESQTLRQPFGAARQYLNQTLARRRAEQLQHVRLARLAARMGYAEAAGRQAAMVPAASARLRCRIDCRLSAGHLAADRGQLDEAAAVLPEIEDLLHRAIECGAIVDPWNILGFGGQFSKFPAVEDSIHDHRIDELIALMGEIFALYARLRKEAAAAGRPELGSQLSEGLRSLADWWDQFASTEVSGVKGISGRQAWESADQVAAALDAWRAAGTAAGQVGFWREHAEQFRTGRAYALLVEALLQRPDPVASMALLMHWLSQAAEIPLAEEGASFYALALKWMRQLWDRSAPAADPRAADAAGRWALACKFLDFLEANADEYWAVPALELHGGAAEAAEPRDQRDGLYGAAYENVVYRDTTDDGFEGEMLEGGGRPTDFELSAEAERISGRLAFLATVAELRKVAAEAVAAEPPPADLDPVLAGWLKHTASCRRATAELLAAAHRYPIAPPRAAYDALLEYERRRWVKENLLERILAAALEMAEAQRWIATTMTTAAGVAGEPWEAAALEVLRALQRGQADRAGAAWPAMLAALSGEPLLYLPLARGGDPRQILRARTLHAVLRQLLEAAPRLGLISETFRLIQAAQQAERLLPVGPGAITEFDRLFEAGFKGIVQCLAVSSEQWPAAGRGAARRRDRMLVEAIESASEVLLRHWLEHSRNVRVSVLQAVQGRERWRTLKDFIQRYGHDLFTQKFMNPGNLRAILHEGVDRWLRGLQESGEEPPRLLAELDAAIPRAEAVQMLELILEAVVENYAEYADYNSTTTQSDRGEMLYTLLDFLRVQASYQRVAWNLKPVVLAHEVLVRAGRGEAAQLWREAVTQRSAELAEEHLQRFGELVAKYGMQLPTVADRLRERFVRPLAVNRLRALVAPAVEELRGDGEGRSFAALEKEIGRFTDEPGGVGFETPAWLEALEQEVDEVRQRLAEPGSASPQRPPVRLSREQVRRAIASWTE